MQYIYIHAHKKRSILIERLLRFLFSATVAPCEDTYDFGACAFDFANGRHPCCCFGTNLRWGAEIAAVQMGALRFFGLECLAHHMGNRVTSGILCAEIDIERDMAEIGVHMKGKVPVRQECHERYMSVFLYVADDLQGDEIKRCKSLGDFCAQCLFADIIFPFAVIKVHCQQPRLNVHSLQSP